MECEVVISNVISDLVEEIKELQAQLIHAEIREAQAQNVIITLEEEIGRLRVGMLKEGEKVDGGSAELKNENGRT